MRIEQLQAFLAVTETGNFGQAAKKCGVTQSTISRQIQSLEQDLGLLLFHRTSQAKLTVGGEKLLPRALKICQEWEKVCAEFTDLAAGKQPELCVAAIHSVCAHYLPPVLQKFCATHPEIQLRVTALGSDRALKVLRDGLVDVAIVMNNRFLTSSAEMVVDVLYEEEIQVLMSVDHPLTKYETITWSELVKYPQVVFKDGYGMQRLVQEWFARHNVEPKTIMELNTLDAFRGVVRQGEIIALLPQAALIESRKDPTLAVRSISTPDQLISQDISSVELKNHLTRQVVLVTTSDRLSIPPIAYFCNLVKQMNHITTTLLNEKQLVGNC
ncbi:transcriptional regulator, LysR family [Stanieria cyanosphaera PCC 7437]|uniref:Transcriptional regulator, LysR family n=1 Tax=Stanieria cyanosphaera (strain ATCC 29371 / PCC 7437) TaxID=111780 RepID=K9XSR1_STAC7|nr:LysR family transcriptional regulator [Stanieria cyanosphaera]AFZ35568.1 transcriptional regulator, LysR family [Stanieria cyanosphaera PCC 7437]